MTLQPVVAAAIVDDLAHPTRLLAAARSYPEDLKGLYELPGGKVDPGESPAPALDREIWEELGCRITLGPLVCPPLGVQDSRNSNTNRTTTSQNDVLASSRPIGQPWPILNGRVMWVWLAEVSDGSSTPSAMASHLHLLWVPLHKAAELPWLSSNGPIVDAVVAQALAGHGGDR